MRLLERQEYSAVRAVLLDAVNNEGGTVAVDDERAAAVDLHGLKKCVFADLEDFEEYADRYGLYGHICLLGAPREGADILGFSAEACKTYVYEKPMPPSVELPHGVVIKRLAPTLAGTVAERYSNAAAKYTAERVAELMRTKGVFGAIADGKLAGFIGRHDDGSMGMLEVFGEFRRRGIGSALEKFLINYIMTFGRTPVCDVYCSNSGSMALQEKCGMTPSLGYTFWGDVERRQS